MRLKIFVSVFLSLGIACWPTSLGIAIARGQIAQPPATDAALDAVVLQAMRTFEVPGMAVGIVKDGKLIYAKGYGVRKLGSPELVDAQTRFGIASNTKAFTAAALAMLVDEGKLRWDDAAGDRLPNLRMFDPYASRELTIRDLLSHRCGLGLGAGDLMFFPPTDFTRDEILRRVRFVRPASSFRDQYHYSNVMYLAAGQVVPAVTGVSWDTFIEERIFKPLGMVGANTSVAKYRAGENVAMPHAKSDGKLIALTFAPSDNWAPAGAINASVEDAAKWVAVQLGRGEYPGGRLWSKQRSNEMWSAVTPVPISANWEAIPKARPNFMAYALGWFLSDYRGQKLVWHTGGLAGMVTRITLVPERNLGVIVLTNQEVSGAFQSVTYAALDRYLGIGDATDWVASYGKVRDQGQARAEAVVKKAEAARNANSKPSLPLPKYAGRFRDDWYGDIAIEEKAGKLSIRFTHSKGLIGTLEHWQYDTFVARWTDRSLLADAYLTFALNPDGSIERAKMVAVSPLTDFSFDFHDLNLKPAPATAPPR